EIELEYYTEIINTSSSKQNSFKIVYSSLNEDNIHLLIMTFKNSDGTPELNETIHITKTRVFQHIKTKEFWKFRTRVTDGIDFQNDNDLFEYALSTPLKGFNFKELKKSNLPESFNKTPLILISFNIQINYNDSGVDIFNSKFINNLVWFAPIRSEPKRTYDSYQNKFSSKGDHIPYLLKNLYKQIDSKRELVSFRQILEKFGEESGLFKGIKINPLGKLSTSPFEILIQFKTNSYKILNVGYGVSQILPLLIQILATVDRTWFSLQQPEVHLHPKAQAAFGEFLFNAMIKQNHNFIVETHSDFLIDRFRYTLFQKNTLKESTIKNYKSQLIFFERTNKGNRLFIIPIEEDGKYSENQPETFRRFFIKEELNLIKL